MSTKTKSTVQHVHFSITGEFITEHARDKVQEGDWAGAIRFLKTSVIGFTYDHAISVLSGEMCLTGENNLQLEKDTSPKDEYLRQLDYLYGSYVKLDGHWYKPYACVTNYGFKDICEFDRDTPFINGQEVRGDCRARHYCEERTDKIFVLNCGTALSSLEAEPTTEKNRIDRGYRCVLFTQTVEPPVWMQFTKTPQQAVDSCRDLVEDGHVQRYGDNFYGDDRDKEDSVFYRYEKRMMAIAEAEEKKKAMKIEPPVEDKKFKSHLGWVSPTGEFYGCCYTGHIDLSYEIVKGLLNIDDFDNSELELEKRGWLKIGGGGEVCYFERGIKNSKSGEEFELTQAQIDTLHDWSKACKRPFPNHLLKMED
jgi:hypothetical protein